MQLERHNGRQLQPSGGTNDLADILERVLDKGIVVAGDIAINLLDIELLTIKVRLLIASADTAKEMGIDWWEHDPFLTGGKANGEPKALEEGDLGERLGRIEAALDALGNGTRES
jgi:hypothetical protein